MINIAIIDDLLEDLELINKYVEEYAIKHQCPLQIIKATSISNIIDKVSELNIIILDVLLQDTTGIEEARKLHQLNQELKIIFCSINKDYSIEAFEVSGFRYLVKPVVKSKLFEYIDDAMKLFDESMVVVTDINQRIRKINQTNIYFIEMYRRKSIVHLKDGSTITIIKSMKEWMKILNENYFMISHKGILVNIRQIKKIEDNMVVLRNGQKVYLSRNYKKQFTNMFYNYMDNML